MSQLQIIDSHQHFWEISRFKYEWMSPDDNILYHDFLPGSFAEILQKNGVVKTVAVQAHQSLAETFWLLELAHNFEFIAGVVGWADLLSDDFGKQLDEFVKDPKFKGVRHIVQDEPQDDWIIQPKVLGNIAKLANYDLTYDILIFPRHLPYIPTVIENCPGVKFVIDHLAKPPIATGEISGWKNNLKTVAAYPQVFCKLSGLVTEADHQDWTSEDLRPYVETAVEIFGPERLMFGSDYPVCLRAADYERVLAAHQSFLRDLSGNEQQKIMRENASRFYSLEV